MSDIGRSALLTDLYQLTMLHAYREHGLNGTAVFELFVRRLPSGRNFFVAAGLEQALGYLEGLRFTPEEIDWVAGCGRFPRDFADYLADLQFTGDVHAMPEGTIFFPDEPVLRVTAPLAEAQLVETRLLNLIHFQTLVASKAARCVLAAPGRLLVDFGLRRAHGAEAGLLAARAAYIAGFAGTATVAAAARMDIPVFGTMAHSFIQAHDDEALAFEHYALAFPRETVLLLDTYDTEDGARTAVAVARRLRERSVRLRGVRLDSGDLAALAGSVRAILDEGGLADATIFASGNLDEYRLRDLVSGGAPIDGFGVGSSLVTSADAPVLDAVYKLQVYGGRARRKRSTGKATWPGCKQVYRRSGDHGYDHDVITPEGDAQPGTPLIVPVMRHGRRLAMAESLAAMRERTATQLAHLPAALKGLESTDEPYRVKVSSALRELAAEADRYSGQVPALLR